MNTVKRKAAFKSLLLKHGVKQRDIASAVGVSDPVVSNWVNQIKPIPRDHIPKVAKLLKTTQKKLSTITGGASCP